MKVGRGKNRGTENIRMKKEEKLKAREIDGEQRDKDGGIRD